MKKKIKPSYVPVVKSLGDVSNFDEYPDSGVTAQDIKPSLDPFLTWWLMKCTSILFILFLLLLLFLLFFWLDILQGYVFFVMSKQGSLKLVMVWMLWWYVDKWILMLKLRSKNRTEEIHSDKSREIGILQQEIIKGSKK